LEKHTGGIWSMTISEGRWIPPFETGDDMPYSNHHQIDDLTELARTHFDLVIVGGGGAGAVAAIEAADCGASVLILEATLCPGGNTQISGGTIRIIDDPRMAVEHLVHLAQGATPTAVIEAFVSGMEEIEDWIVQHGGSLEVRSAPVGKPHDRVFPVSRPGSSFPNFPGGDALGRRGLVPPRREGRKNGAALWDLLAENLERLEIAMVLGARVSHLCTDEHRGVVGVEVGTDGGPIRVTAERGVILACGGFAYDRELMTQYYGLPLPTVCLPERAIGDGVRLAADAGADLWHMNAVACSVGYRLPGLDAGIQAKMPDYGFVLVDQNARRYVSETDLENHSAVFPMTAQDPITGEYLRAPSFLIFDEQTRRSGTVAHLPHGANRHYPWSADNAVEIDRGWIQRAGTLAELAASLGLSAAALESCIDEFNDLATRGVADGFGRSPVNVRAIDQPPFYGVAVYPIIVNTQGGPRRDEHGRILRPNRTPIPGLYGAGELGSLWNRLYPGAGNLSECLVSGRIAAKSALESD
jgi:succinate dehydrogenase/fumarate reductase flavoprotein subunit